MKKERRTNVTKDIPRLDMDRAYLGPWVPASTVVIKGKSLPKALEPHAININGIPSVPVQLLNSLRPPK